MRARARKQARREARKAAREAVRYLPRPLPPAPASHPTLYLGFGSNMHIEHMQSRCPHARPLARGMMPDHELVFAGVLTVEPKEGSSVPVGIWRVPLVDIPRLDRYEGYPISYDKRFVHVTVDGVREEAFYYVLTQPYSLASPSPTYYDICRVGYENFRFDEAPLAEARERAREADRMRRAMAGAGEVCEVCGANDVEMAPFEVDGCLVCRDCATVLGLYSGTYDVPQEVWP